MRWIALASMLLSPGAVACNGSQNGAEACVGAGGQCVLESARGSCATLGPPGCDTGGFCCLSSADAGDAVAEGSSGDGGGDY